MRLLYLGDVMAEPGLRVIEQHLPALKKAQAVDVVIAQAENLSDGKGVRPADLKRLFAAGVDGCTGGNHTTFRPEIYSQLQDPNVPLIRPANYPAGTAGKGWAYVDTPKGKVLIISMLGQIVGKQASEPVDNPLHTIDRILAEQTDVPRMATVVNLHGDFSSEKRMFGAYLDGRVSAVVGDHWHIQTADAEVQPKGTAYQTDVGMCGSLDSSLGVRFADTIPRWRDGTITTNTMEPDGRMQLNGLLVDIAADTGLATGVQLVRLVYPAQK